MAKIVRLVTAPERIQQETAATVRRAAVELGVPANEVRILVARLREMTSPEKTNGLWPGGFVMISREKTGEIWKAIDALPTRKNRHLVRRVFDQVLLNLNWDDGMVLLSRDQIADEIGCLPRDVSSAMTTLHQLGVIERERNTVSGMKGQGPVTYFVNADVAWHGSLNVRAERAALQKQRRLTVINGSLTEEKH